MIKKGRKTPSPPPRPPLLKAEYLSLLRAGMSTDSGDELSLGHFHCRKQRRCMVTETSKTVDELRQQGHRPPPSHRAKAQQLRLRTTRHLSLHTSGMQQPVQNSTSCKLWELDCLHTDCTRTAGPAQQQRRPCQWTATGESQRFSEQSGPRETASAPRQRCRRP